MAEFTANQVSVLVMLADVARHEGGEAMVKRRFYGAAISLCRRGLATERDRFPYRPVYQITPAGMAVVERMEAADERDGDAGRPGRWERSGVGAEDGGEVSLSGATG